tara:strand:+ start:1115 stop:1762 length:648 start_codon:yes stop_codon:yes gene_type:complete
MSFTYDQLKQAIQDYTENNETTFVNNLPLFIRAAEERILKNVQLDLFRRNQTATLTTGNPYLRCPSDFLAPFSLSYTLDGSREFIEYKDVSFVQMYNPDTATRGAPKYYAQFDVSNFLVGPTPDVDYDVELHYLYRPTSITSGAADGTTWISLNGELALLYGALVEAYIFMKGEADVMQQYNQRFNESMIGLKMLGEAKQTTQEYRVGKVVRPKQ